MRTKHLICESTVDVESTIEAEPLLLQTDNTSGTGNLKGSASKASTIRRFKSQANETLISKRIIGEHIQRSIINRCCTHIITVKKKTLSF